VRAEAPIFSELFKNEATPKVNLTKEHLKKIKWIYNMRCLQFNIGPSRGEVSRGNVNHLNH